MGRSDQCFPNGLIKCECNVSTFQVKHTKIQLGFSRRPRYRHFHRKGFGARELDVFLERVLVKLLLLWSHRLLSRKVSTLSLHYPLPVLFLEFFPAFQKLLLSFSLNRVTDSIIDLWFLISCDKEALFPPVSKHSASWYLNYFGPFFFF